MKMRGVTTAAMLVLALASCGKSTTTSNTTMAMSSTTMANMGYGTAGDASKADRTIDVHILPSLKYDPVAISVRPGETVAFNVTNQTTGIHEFVLGDDKVQTDYENHMKSMGTNPMTMPDQSNLLNLQPGATKQLAWTFPAMSGMSVIYGSHEPGDYSKGLKGMITVTGSPVASTNTTMGGMTSTTSMGGMTSTTMGGMTSTTGMGGMPGMTTTTMK